MNKLFSALSSFQLSSSPVSASANSVSGLRVLSASRWTAQRQNLLALLVACVVFSFASTAAAEGEVTAEPAILNINTADAEMIAAQLNGIGAVRAQAIVNYRLKHGDFLHIDELQDVPGIGEVTFERIKSILTVTSRSMSDKPSGAATAQLAAPNN